MQTEKNPQYRAINGLSYKVIGTLLSSKTMHKFARAFFERKIFILKARRHMYEKSKTVRSKTDKANISNITSYMKKFPISNFRMGVYTPIECSEKEANIVLWAKEDRLVCPGCEPLKMGRECFELGANHELMLPFLGFWSTDLRNRNLDPERFSTPYLYHDKKKYYSFESEMFGMEVLPIPLNVRCNNKVEIFLLVPRVCQQKKVFYLWQYRLLDRAVSNNVFNNRCRICGSNNIDMNPPVSSEVIVLNSQALPKSLKGIKPKKYLTELSKFARQPISPTQRLFCNNCREYSFLFQKTDYPEMLNIEGKGLCSNCYMPVEYLIEEKNLLKCSNCGKSTPLYEKFSRKDNSEKLE